MPVHPIAASPGQRLPRFGLDRASPPLDESRMGHLAVSGTLVVHGPGSAGRTRVERFIQAAYARQFGACVAEFAPVLVARERDDVIVAAAGYRRATEALFLEQYLDLPIELHLDPPGMVDRACIAEVGHLSSCLPGEGRRLMALLASHLATQGIEWVASTVTVELRRVMRRLGVAATCLAPARADRLKPAETFWGSYYAHRPQVVVGHIPTSLRQLEATRRGETR